MTPPNLAFQISKKNERELTREVERLTAISIRQSVMLAQAMKEKNDLLFEKHAAVPSPELKTLRNEIERLKEELRIAKLDLASRNERIRKAREAVNVLRSI